jgi:hypothetical protein
MSDDPNRIPAAERLPRRVTDRVEDLVAWVLTAAALLVVVLACLTGLVVHGREAERVDVGSGSRSQARAVLLEDAASTTDAAVVSRSARAGSEIVVWIDAAGKIAAPPLRPVNAVAGGAVSAIGVLCAGTTVLVAILIESAVPQKKTPERCLRCSGVCSMI